MPFNMDNESQLSPMEEIVIPSTPPPQPLRSSNTSEMTPPPSTQPPRTLCSAVRPKAAQDPFHSPTPVKIGNERITAGNIAKASLEELRAMVQDLIQQLNEAHLSAAHFQLQHHLLSLDSQESAQRAEIEHQMSRREVEFLQASDRRRSAQPSTPRVSQSPSQPPIDTLLKTYRALEAEKQEDKRRLRKAKRVIEVEMGKNEALYEENSMLKQRIHDNREHFNQFMQSSAFPTPRADLTPRRSAREIQRSRMGRDQDPFAALLAADQVLSGEAASVPSTPTRVKPAKFRGHTRGAYSLSSLHTTPGQPIEPVYARSDRSVLAPATEPANLDRERRRRRDSTISASDDEVLTDQDLPQSQASSLAASMLRRSQEGASGSAKAEKSSKVLQTKLFGQVKKAGGKGGGSGSGKRKGSFEGGEAKKAKLGEGVGLGLGMGIGVGGRWGRVELG